MSDKGYKIIKGEQQTDEWQKLREGKITGSVAKQVKGTGNAFLYETLAMMTTKREPKQAYGVHVERGNELEPEARVQYERLTKQTVDQVAFIENDRYGISPDGVIFKTKKKDSIKKLLEIKCPDTNTHIRYLLEKKLPSEHKDQVIHGFVVCDDVDEIDFVSYCPAFTFNQIWVLTIRRQDYITEITTARIAYEKFIEKLDKYYKELIL